MPYVLLNDVHATQNVTCKTSETHGNQSKILSSQELPEQRILKYNVRKTRALISTFVSIKVCVIAALVVKDLMAEPRKLGLLIIFIFMPERCAARFKTTKST